MKRRRMEKGFWLSFAGMTIATILIIGSLVVVGFFLLMAIAMLNFGSNK